MKRIAKDHYVLSFAPEHKPIEHVESGETVIFETFDCFGNQIQRENQVFSSIGWDLVNPATGPLYINEALPGDTLKVEILDIVIKNRGVMTTAPNLGVLGDIIPDERTKMIEVKNNKAIFNNKLHIPIKPMIGVIGTAPKKATIPTGTPGDHGGNMDCKRIIKGSTLYLPVNVDGALLAMGDLHAVMADGEVSISGLEIPGEVKVKVTVLKDKKLPLPLLVDESHIMTIASAETLDEAGDVATKNMHRFLKEAINMNVHEAAMLLSLIGDLKICQVVDPLKTARMELPLYVLEEYKYKVD